MTIIQLDIFGNVVPQKLCKCGCGEPVYNGNDYINGHYVTSEIGRKEHSERLIQFHIDNPNVGQEISDRQIQYYIDHPEARDEMSKIKNQYYIDHPEWGEEHSKQLIQFHIDNPEVRAGMSEKKIQFLIDNPDAAKEHGLYMRQYYIDHPEARDKAAEMALQYYKDHPDAGEEHGLYMKQYYIDHPEVRERQSAVMKREDYDKGEWTGFAPGVRDHINPISRCIQLNEYFPGCQGHHITRSIVIFIPIELHQHIGHSLKTGRGMAEINMLALQFINGEL